MPISASFKSGRNPYFPKLNFPFCLATDLHTMCRLYRCRSNEILSLLLFFFLRSITDLLLKSFPDNRWCFRGLVLRADPSAEQRALEEQACSFA